jgi:hypothetical protein
MENNKPQIKAVEQSLFPTLGSLNEAVELAESKVPVNCKNEMHSLLMTYHNTLLKEVKNAP